MSIAVEGFAEELLFGKSLDDKLRRHQTIRYDSRYSAIETPKMPARPSMLHFSNERLPFPRHFVDATSRAQAF